MTAHRELDERFADWVDGRLSPIEVERLESEMRADPDLARMAAQYRATVDILRSAAPAGPVPRNFIDALMTALPDARDPTGHRRWFPFLASGLAAAAMFGLYFLLSHVPQRSDSRPLSELMAKAPEEVAAPLAGGVVVMQCICGEGDSAT